MNRTSLALCSLLGTLGSALVAAGLDQVSASSRVECPYLSTRQTPKVGSPTGNLVGRSPVGSSTVAANYFAEGQDQWLTSPGWRSIDVNRRLATALVVPKIAPVDGVKQASPSKPAAVPTPTAVGGAKASQKPAAAVVAKQPSAKIAAPAKPAAAAPSATVAKSAPAKTPQAPAIRGIQASVKPAVTNRVQASTVARIDQHGLARLLKMVDTNASNAMTTYIVQNDGLNGQSAIDRRAANGWARIPLVEASLTALPWTPAVHIGGEAGHVFDTPVTGAPVRIAFDSLRRRPPAPVQRVVARRKAPAVVVAAGKILAEVSAWQRDAVRQLNAIARRSSDLGTWLDDAVATLAPYARWPLPNFNADRRAAVRNAQLPSGEVK